MSIPVATADPALRLVDAGHLQPTLLDHTELVTAAAVVRPDPGVAEAPPTTGTAVPDEPPNSVQVLWFGSPCQDRPTLVVREAQDSVLVQVHEGRVRATPERPCEAIGVTQAVRLYFSESPPPITVQVREGDPRA